MVLQIYFTDDEIRRFFEANGFTCEVRNFGQWEPTTHGHGEFVQVPRMALIFPNGKYVRADTLFEQVITARMKRQLTPNNLETQRLIETVFKNGLKSA